MIDYLRRRLARQLAGHGGSPEEVGQAQRLLDPEALTVGFARRFATYKRPNLLLTSSGRLLELLMNQQRPVQLVLAGKAHPQDLAGQAMIRQWIEFIRHTPARAQAVFLSDDDMSLTEHLVQGVDLWLNTPRRPWEACGTSGMKVLVNGGLNCSNSMVGGPKRIPRKPAGRWGTARSMAMILSGTRRKRISSTDYSSGK
jgi:starch phosphorylase